MLRSLFILATVVSLVGCARTSIPGPPDDGAVGDAGVDSGRIGQPAPDEDGGFPPHTIFEDLGCDAGTASGGGFQSECDPYDPSTCDPGLACYTWAVAPEDDCSGEVYIAACAPAGRGTQGDGCFGQTDCRGLHSCVVTGAGTQCAQRCDLEGGEPRCPRGLLCRATDVPGSGVCF